MPRFTDIDIAKGICILLVVIGHYAPDNSPEWYLTLIKVIYCFHMPLFMYTSGFVFHATQKPVKYRYFILKKAKRLMIPYVLVSWLIICIKLFAEKGMYVENPVSFSSFYEILYYPSAGYFLWFVYVLFLIFLIIPFFNTPNKINLLLLLSLIWMILPIPTTDLFCLAQMKSHLFYFVLGCFVNQQQTLRFKLEKMSIYIPVLGFVILYLFVQHYNNTPTILSQCAYACMAMAGIVVILRIAGSIDANTKKSRHILLQLALYSYTIYLFHTTFEGVAKSFFIKYPLTGYLGDNISFFIMVLVTTTVGVTGPILLHQANIRLRNILFKRKSLK